MQKISAAIITLALGLPLSGCGLCSKDEKVKLEIASPTAAVVEFAYAKIQPLAKGSVSGTAKLKWNGAATILELHIKGLKPRQKSGFHIHEFGDCSATDGSSAGGHFNPRQTAHGGPEDAIHHAGDMGNLTADAKGEVEEKIKIPGVALATLIGRSLVVHAKEDDLKSQPAGGSGDRVACGVIGLSK
jgi:superoxide dismutase, Cu-Zn family